MNAQEARERTKENLEKIAEQDLIKVFEEIENRCIEGKYELFFEGILSAAAIEGLEQRGFKVKYVTGDLDDYGEYYDGYFRINWKERRKLWREEEIRK